MLSLLTAGRHNQPDVVRPVVLQSAVEVVPVVLVHEVQVVQVPPPVERVVPAKAGQVGAHAWRDEVVDAGAPPVAVPLTPINHPGGGCGDVPLSATLTLLLPTLGLLATVANTTRTNQSRAGTGYLLPLTLLY